MSQWDGAELYDLLEFAQAHKWRRRCPKCSETDVKFAIHSKLAVGCEVSAYCNDCKHGESGDRVDADRIVRNWHEAPSP